MVDGTDKNLSMKNDDSPSNSNIIDKLQKLLDNNVRIARNVSWIIGGVGIIIIIRRTYALHHFTNLSMIPEIYFKNNATLTGRVLEVHNDGTLGVLHIPLLWKARLKWISEPRSTLLDVNITGVELRNGGTDYLSLLLKDTEVKFKLLGRSNCKHIESILYQKKGWFRQICINEDIIKSGYAVASHVQNLSQCKAYNQLIERLVKAEVRAVKGKAGIWKEDSDTKYGIFYRLWHWLKSRTFKT